MSVGIFGPPVGFPIAQPQPRVVSSMQLEPVSRHRKVELETDSGLIRLQHRTIQKYLPGLWGHLLDHGVHHHRRMTVDPGHITGLQQPVYQTCISQLFQHLSEMERTDVNSMKLTDWLESLYRRSLHDVDYIRHSNLSKLTNFFEGLGKVLSPRKFGGHRTFFDIMSLFFTKYCRDLFRQLHIEDFLKYVYALDRMRQTMRSVLPQMLQSIGKEGRRRLLNRDLYPGSNFHLLRPTTRHAIRKIVEAKKQREYGRALIPYQSIADSDGQILRMRTPTGLTFPRRGHIARPKRQFGRHAVVFPPHRHNDRAPYQFIGMPPNPRAHHQLHHVGVPSGYITPGMMTPRLSDIDDSSSYLGDDYDLASNYGLGHTREFEDYHGYTPRRVSFSGLEDGLRHGIHGQPWDIPGTPYPGTPYYDTEFSEDGFFERGLLRRGSW